MKHFAYEAPESIEEASRLLKTGRAAACAGGTDLTGVLKEKLLPVYPETVVSLKGIPGLDGIEVKEDGLHLGAMATLADIAQSETVKNGWAALSDAAYSVATPNLRSTATVGGNICQDVRCWYYRYPDSIGGRIDCARKEGVLCSAMMGENRYHSIFGAAKVSVTPCTGKCPAHTDISAYMEKLREGDMDAAARILMEVNPMPAITSRVCAHFCMEDCNRGQYDESLNVGAVERTIGDYILDHSDRFMTAPGKENGKKIAIIGSGPAGLTTAFYLRQAGYAVTIYERQEEAGGCLTYAIPAYRLPKEVVRRFVSALEKMGVAIRCKINVGADVKLDDIIAQSDSTMLDTGTWKRPLIGLAGEELTRFGLDFLTEVNHYIHDRPGANVVVVGGGNVAMDVAVTAKRLGSAKVTMLCLETREEMPANQEEIDRALQEEVEICNAWGPKEVLHRDGKVTGITFRRCTRTRDENGAFSPLYNDEETITLDADVIFMAVGQQSDLSFLEGAYQFETVRGRLSANDDQMTSVAGVFATGDAVYGPATVIKAIAFGKTTAISINEYNKGGLLPVQQATISRPPRTALSFCAGCTGMKEAVKQPELPEAERTIDSEDLGGIPQELACKEAARCFNCGCLAVNPSDMANMLYAYDAKIVTNQRVVSAKDFFGTYAKIQTVLHPGEVVTEIVVPPVKSGTAARYSKFRLRNAIDFAVVAVASAVRCDETGVVTDASLVLGAVAPVARRCEKAEQYLIGKKLDADTAAKAADLCLEGAIPLDCNQYKIDVTRTLVRRTLLGE